MKNKRLFGIIFIIFEIFMLIPIINVSLENNTFIEQAFDLDNKQLNHSYNILKDLYGVFNNIFSSREVKSGESIFFKDENGMIHDIKKIYKQKDNKSDKIIALSEFCTNKDIDFLYVAFPRKSVNKDFSKYGYDFKIKEANDEYLMYAKQSVNYLDLSSILYSKYPNEDIHYKTDHHWKTPYALDAALETAKYLNNKFDYNLNLDLLDSNKFTKKTYKDIWVGEQGKKNSIAWSGYDDFILMKPNYLTSYLVNGYNTDFSAFIYNEALLEKNEDYYDRNYYYTYCKNCNSETKYHNNFIQGKKVLLIQDSFSMVYGPFLSLVFEDLTFYDLRVSTGSLYDYISTHDFDLVIVAYSNMMSSKMYNFY